MVDSAALAQADAIDGFWNWWEQAAAPVGDALDSGNQEALVDVMSQWVASINPGLAWEFGEGVNAPHHLCVAGGGNPELRTVAERWLRRAPESSGRWEYYSARQPHPSALDIAIGFGGIRVAIGETRFEVHHNESNLEADLGVFNPAFASMSADQRSEVMYLICDVLLGEDVVEQWVGAINTVVTPSLDAVSGEALIEVMKALQVRNPQPRWVLMEGASPDGGRVVVRTVQPMKRAAYPLFDLYGTITVAFASQRADGMPAEQELTRLEAVERSLVSALGSDGVLVVTETTSRARRLHVYCDSHSSIPEQLSDYLGDFGVEWWLDAAWDGVRRFRPARG